MVIVRIAHRTMDIDTAVGITENTILKDVSSVAIATVVV